MIKMIKPAASTEKQVWSIVILYSVRSVFKARESQKRAGKEGAMDTASNGTGIATASALGRIAIVRSAPHPDHTLKMENGTETKTLKYVERGNVTKGQDLRSSAMMVMK